MAAELEGHPDNVAAALNGGLTLAWRGEDGPRALGFEPPPVGFVAVIAGQTARDGRGAGGAAGAGAARRRGAHGGRAPRCWWRRWERATPT